MSTTPPLALSSPSQKKVVVRRFHRDWIAGYLPPVDFVAGSGADARIRVLDLAGRVVTLGLEEVKMVSFVRDFHPNDPQPERLLRKTFIARPRSTGLWVRMTFRDNDLLEGLCANDLTLLEAEGLLFAPPDTRSNTQRIYVPRIALSELRVLAAIGTPSRRPIRPQAAMQDELFHAELPPNSRPN